MNITEKIRVKRIKKVEIMEKRIKEKQISKMFFLNPQGGESS